MKYLMLFTLVVIQPSCQSKKLTETTSLGKDTTQEVDNKSDSLQVPGATLSAGNLIIDTLTEAEFISSFKEEQRTRYNIRNDKSLRPKTVNTHTFRVHKKLLINDTLKNISIWGDPLSFKQKGRVKWVTTLSEGENSLLVMLFTLDNYYNKVDNIIISEAGGDEGYQGWSIGEFKDDSTYLMKSFETGFETDSIKYTVNSCLIIHSNGKINKIENCR